MMAGGATLRLGPLAADHQDELATFRCRQFKAPWTDGIEELVQTRLAGELELGAIEALGLWRDDLLVGVVAWSRQPARPEVLHCVLLAVRTGHLRRGHGMRLKSALLEHGRAAGALAIESDVHFDNDPMLELNLKLGANIERISGDPDYLFCVIRL